MNALRRICCLLGAMTLVVASGCAAAYHDYPDGCVAYDYCPLPPLPYATYQACPTPVAQCYSTVGETQPSEPVPTPQATVTDR